MRTVLHECATFVALVLVSIVAAAAAVYPFLDDRSVDARILEVRGDIADVFRN